MNCLATNLEDKILTTERAISQRLRKTPFSFTVLECENSDSDAEKLNWQTDENSCELDQRAGQN